MCFIQFRDSLFEVQMSVYCGLCFVNMTSAESLQKIFVFLAVILKLESHSNFKEKNFIYVCLVDLKYCPTLDSTLSASHQRCHCC